MDLIREELRTADRRYAQQGCGLQGITSSQDAARGVHGLAFGRRLDCGVAGLGDESRWNHIELARHPEADPQDVEHRRRARCQGAHHQLRVRGRSGRRVRSECGTTCRLRSGRRKNGTDGWTDAQAEWCAGTMASDLHLGPGVVRSPAKFTTATDEPQRPSTSIPGVPDARDINRLRQGQQSRLEGSRQQDEAAFAAREAQAKQQQLDAVARAHAARRATQASFLETLAKSINFDAVMSIATGTAAGTADREALEDIGASPDIRGGRRQTTKRVGAMQLRAGPLRSRPYLRRHSVPPDRH